MTTTPTNHDAPNEIWISPSNAELYARIEGQRDPNDTEHYVRANHDAVSRREVVERLREVAAPVKHSKRLTSIQLKVDEAICGVLNALADEFEQADSVKAETAPSHSPVVIPQDIRLTLAEIRAKQSDGYEEVSRGEAVKAALIMLRDVRTLLQIIDSLTATAVCPRCSALMADFPESRTSSAFCDGCGYEQPRNPITQATSGLPSEQLPDASSLRHLYNLLKEYGQHKRSCTVETTDCVCGFSEKISNLVPPSALLDPQRRTPHLFEPHDSDEDDSNYCRICDKYQFDERFHLTPSPLPEGGEQPCLVCGWAHMSVIVQCDRCLTTRATAPVEEKQK